MKAAILVIFLSVLAIVAEGQKIPTEEAKEDGTAEAPCAKRKLTWTDFFKALGILALLLFLYRLISF